MNINGVAREARPCEGTRRGEGTFQKFPLPRCLRDAAPERRDALTVDVRLQKVNKPWNIARSRRARARHGAVAEDRGWRGVAPYYPSRGLSAPCGIKSTMYLAETLALDTSKGTKTTTVTTATAFDYVPLWCRVERFRRDRARNLSLYKNSGEGGGVGRGSADISRKGARQ